MSCIMVISWRGGVSCATQTRKSREREAEGHNECSRIMWMIDETGCNIILGINMKYGAPPGAGTRNYCSEMLGVTVWFFYVRLIHFTLVCFFICLFRKRFFFVSFPVSSLISPFLSLFLSAPLLLSSSLCISLSHIILPLQNLLSLFLFFSVWRYLRLCVFPYCFSYFSITKNHQWLKAPSYKLHCLFSFITDQCAPIQEKIGNPEISEYTFLPHQMISAAAWLALWIFTLFFTDVVLHVCPPDVLSPRIWPL